MNENIDLTKILEGCEGIELYTTTHGYAELTYVDDQCDFSIGFVTLHGATLALTKEGHASLSGNAECVVFPSKEQRDWSKFVRPIKRGTPMMCSDDKGIWTLMLYEMCKEHEHYVSRIYTRDALKFKYMIRFEDFNPNDIEGSLKYNIQK